MGLPPTVCFRPFQLIDDAFEGGDLTGRRISITSGLSGGVSRPILSHVGDTITIENIDLDAFAIDRLTSPTEFRGLSTLPVAGDSYIIDGFGVLIDDGSKNQVGGTETGQGKHHRV